MSPSLYHLNSTEDQISFPKVVGKFKLNKDGTVLASGGNHCGELGLGSKETYIDTETELPPLPNNEKIKDLYIASNHTFFRTTTDQLYVCGDNTGGQLGLGHTNPVVHTPERVLLPEGETVAQIFGRDCSTMIITQSGKLYAYGYNHGLKKDRYGSELTKECYLGIDTDSEYLSIPTQIQLPQIQLPVNEKVINVIKPSFYFMILIKTEYRTFIYGDNQHGQLGLGHENPVYSPALVSLPNYEVEVFREAITNSITFIFLKSGNIMACGYSFDSTPEYLDFYLYINRRPDLFTLFENNFPMLFLDIHGSLCQLYIDKIRHERRISHHPPKTYTEAWDQLKLQKINPTDPSFKYITRIEPVEINQRQYWRIHNRNHETCLYSMGWGGWDFRPDTPAPVRSTYLPSSSLSGSSLSGEKRYIEEKEERNFKKQSIE